MAFAELFLLLANWFMLVITMLLTVKAISLVKPYVEQAVVAKTMWYLYMAFGYSLIAVTIFTSWVIWFIGGVWGLGVLFMTWFILVIIYISHTKISEAAVKKTFGIKEPKKE
ncbi:MAG: hypothetical protein NUV67_05705 [archaeon]|nr:hypothetical protein [archaeon]